MIHCFIMEWFAMEKFVKKKQFLNKFENNETFAGIYLSVSYMLFKMETF